MAKIEVEYLLTGFRDSGGYRVFSFERVAADRTRTPFTVRTDLELTRRHRIRLQELPLLCREILEKHGTGEDRDLLFGEPEMALRTREAEAREAAAQQRRRSAPPRTRPGNPAFTRGG